MVARDQVALFLTLLKECVACDFRLERRPENMATLAHLGMTLTDAHDRILGLTPADYLEGPTPRSEDSSQEAWVFGLHIREIDVYVKLSIRIEPARCVCVSFHEAQWPMAYPYREDPRRGSGR
jgi:hypothetical protein